MTRPLEVLIACHNPERNLARAVDSVLVGNGDSASATVIAHNIRSESLASTLPTSLREKVRWLELHDGVPSPANPYNFGIQHSQSPWISFLGSDDYLEAGAARHWGTLSSGADAVITRLIHDSGTPVRTPPVRLFPHTFRNAVTDRLYYRSAPLGALRKDSVVKFGCQWDQNLPTGGDLHFSTVMWSSGNIRVQTSGPAYVIGADAPDRVTMQLAPLAEELQHVRKAWQGGWALELPTVKRTSLGTKYLRIHIFGAAYYRAISNAWDEEDHRELAAATSLILGGAKGCEKPLSIADRNLLDSILDQESPIETVSSLAISRRRFGTFRTLAPRNISSFFDREAPLRFMASSALVR